MNPIRQMLTLEARARAMRGALTRSEEALWGLISSGKLSASVRRQKVIGKFIADFAIPSRRLVIEVDGPCHARRAFSGSMLSSFSPLPKKRSAVCGKPSRGEGFQASGLGGVAGAPPSGSWLAGQRTWRSRANRSQLREYRG